MILNLYRKLSEIAENYIVVTSSEIVYFPSGTPHKLRIFIADGSLLDIWISVSGKYSYHWERRHLQKGIYRSDNAPHQKWKNTETFPKHFHNGTELNVTESFLSDNPEEAIKEVLDFIVSIIRNEA
jgi:hypothetical protein